MGRSAEYVIACLAALRAGGAFLVLELAYPPGLLADVIEDAKPVVIVTSTAQASQIKADIPLIILDKVETGANEFPLSNGHAKKPSPLPAEDDLERLAFVSYSSGTTGRPKVRIGEGIFFLLGDVSRGVPLETFLGSNNSKSFLEEIIANCPLMDRELQIPTEHLFDPMSRGFASAISTQVIAWPAMSSSSGKFYGHF
jgi:hypothetical protein